MPPTLTRPLRLALAVTVVCWTAQFVGRLSSTSESHSLRTASPSSPLEFTTSLSHCTRDGSADETASFVDYERLVYCTRLRDSLPLARTVLVVLLVVLLYLLSSTTDSFFCPVLQAIVEKYRIPPDIAGVTFLSFGNGSPDVFSNIAAFSTATPKIGVTSILGGGLLITTVIAASVGLASQDQDQLIPRKYVRDVVFYLVAVAYFCFVFFDGTVELIEALGFLMIYACYVCVVFLDKKLVQVYCSLMQYDPDEVEEFNPRKHLLAQPYGSGSSWSSSEKSASDLDREPPGTLMPPMIQDYEVSRIPNYNSTSDSEPSLPRTSSAPTPRSKAIADNLVSQHEQLPLVGLQYSKTPRAASVCVPSLSRRKRPRNRTAWETTRLSANTHLTAKRWTRWYHELNGIPELSGVSETGDENEDDVLDASQRCSSPVSAIERTSLWDRNLVGWLRSGYCAFLRYVWNPFEFITTFIRRLTIPLVDDETWDKNVTIACPPCAILLAGVSLLKLNPILDPYFAVFIAVVGGAGSVAIYRTASPLVPPEGSALVPYICLAFVMSVIWIMNIATEVLALLKVLGGLFGLSNSILGVSVLAWGNSIGDLISTTSIARDGFPTMAFAGCFAGPMFNLLVGIGLALTFAILSRGPVSMGEPSPIVYIGFGFLFTSLILNVSFAAADGFRYRARLCYTLFVLYTAFVAIAIAVVLTDERV